MDHGMEPPAEGNHRIVVTGGTCTLGRQVVPRLRDAGGKVRVLSRGSREGAEGLEFVTGDLATGEGIDAAVAGTEIIVHLAGSAKGDEVKARHLVRAASRAGARHLVYISVVGAGRIPVVSPTDRAMFGYFAAKRAAEQVIADAGLPWTTLRATQFHDLTLADRAAAGQATGAPGASRVPLPADRRRGGGGPAGRARPGRAGRPGARPGRAAGVRAGRPRAQLPASHAPAPADPAGLDAGRGRPRVPGRRQPGPRPGGGPPHLGGLPGRPAEFANRQQLSCRSLVRVIPQP